ncbi:MAG TPA: LacI family DNA-binding transcriptional regulator [Candidatus Methylomirabilis sp.]|nr:LacI family DNA-binding transcriptional regulator [Candidatus Methylomirabilis sp.]
MPKRMTMQDVARMAGLSKATVSRAIHAPHLVRPTTRERIMKIIQSNGYVYNAVAGDLSRKQTSVLGLVIPTIRSSIFAMSTIGIQEAAQAEGFAVLIANSGYDPSADAEMIRLLQQRRVAGVILTGLEPVLKPVLQEVTNRGVPCVVTWQNVAEEHTSSVGFDNFKAAYQATDYVLSLKHRRIGLICGPKKRVGRVQQRHDGYQAALEARGMPYDPMLIMEREYSPLEGKEAMRRLLSLPEPPTAVFAASDVLAMGALAAAREHGARVPEDVSVIGFDDIDFAAYCNPPLTTVRVPAYEMGQLAVRVLISLIRGRETTPRRYLLDTDLIVRGSCRELQD